MASKIEPVLGLKVLITKIDDSFYPGFAECEMYDVNGERHCFFDKLPVLYGGDGVPKPPVEGEIACLERSRRGNIVEIDTEFPDDIDSMDGRYVFEVFSHQLIYNTGFWVKLEMKRMRICELTKENLKTVYDTEMVHTFPPCELKPFAAMESLMERGCYRPLGLLENERLVSYLLLWTDESGKYALGDYLGTVASRRNGGLGAKFLQMAFSSFPEFKCILGEAEAPDSGDPDVDALRRRRLAFYERNGLRYLNYDCALFGVHYRCLVYGAVSDEEALEAHRSIYAAQFSPEQMERFIQLPLKPGEAVKPATAWAEE